MKKFFRFFRKMFLVPQGLRYKLMISFSLMSIIPLLVCVYLVTNFIFPVVENLGQVSIIVLLSIMVALLGLVLAKKLVDPVIDLALETKIIAGGDYEKTIEIDREDEIGDLGKAINIITQKIREHMKELHSYSLRTKDVNMEIQKKILALSSLLHIGDMIAASEKLEHILDIVLEKTSDVFEDSLSAFYMTKEETNRLELYASHNTKERNLRSLEFELGKDYLGRSVGAKIIILIDKTAKMTGDLELIQKSFKVKNCLILPVIVRNKVWGFLINGNQINDFRYNEGDVEFVKVLAKQIGIAIENDMLLRKAKEFSFRDDLTGLYNKSFIESRLDEEIRRAVVCQRPCSFLIFNIDDFSVYRDMRGEISTEELLKKVANIVKENATELGKVGRLGGDEFAIILPEKNKREALNIAENIRRGVEKLGVEVVGKGERPVTISAGVSENPIDGANAAELFKKASGALRNAKEQGKNRVVS